jgi:hypothetical protein
MGTEFLLLLNGLAGRLLRGIFYGDVVVKRLMQVSRFALICWSLWTDGRVRIGKIKSTATSSKQETDAFSIGIGLDQYDEDNNLFGVFFTIGKDDVDIGESGSGVVSDNSFSICSAFQPEKLPLCL